MGGKVSTPTSSLVGMHSAPLPDLSALPALSLPSVWAFLTLTFHVDDTPGERRKERDPLPHLSDDTTDAYWDSGTQGAL